MPVRADSQVTFLVDGRHTMWTMCLHFLQARHSIHLANWGITPQMLMVRGSDFARDQMAALNSRR
jgi:phosphatidylserine/phosphatidylglycerophosphate/cardiolipin synthase-like enzyme